MRTFSTGIVLSSAVFVFSIAAQAAFIVEPVAGGKANANFTYQDGTAVSTSIHDNAVGLTPALASAYGGNGTVDRYIFSYTPGTDADNTTFTTGLVLGDTRIDPPGNPSGVSAEAQLASGLTGGTSGVYKVYITWPATGNANPAGSIVTITSDGAPIVLNPVDQNSTASPGPITPSGTGGADKWLLIGTVNLTAGNTYTVTQEANVASFVSQRSAGVMWELQPEAVPEPATIALIGLACLGFVGTRRRA